MKINGPYEKIPGSVRPADQHSRINGQQGKDTAFAQVLRDMLPRQDALKFSAHARQRLEQRQIDLQESDLHRITQAMQSAEKKGARSTLMLYQDLALITNVKNKTVITAMSGEDLKEHIFTNIDSAVIIK